MNKEPEGTLESYYRAEMQKLADRPRLISKSEVKEVFGLSPEVVEGWVMEGKLMPVLESQRIRYIESQVAELVQELIRHNSGKSKGEQ